jgi:hypothetical protein
MWVCNPDEAFGETFGLKKKKACEACRGDEKGHLGNLKY